MVHIVRFYIPVQDVEPGVLQILENKILNLAGGFTTYPSQKGKWLSPSGVVIEEDLRAYLTVTADPQTLLHIVTEMVPSALTFQSEVVMPVVEMSVEENEAKGLVWAVIDALRKGTLMAEEERTEDDPEETTEQEVTNVTQNETEPYKPQPHREVVYSSDDAEESYKIAAQVWRLKDTFPDNPTLEEYSISFKPEHERRGAKALFYAGAELDPEREDEDIFVANEQDMQILDTLGIQYSLVAPVEEKRPN